MGFLGFGVSCLGDCAELGWGLGESFWPFPSPRPHPSPLPPSGRGDVFIVVGGFGGEGEGVWFSFGRRMFHRSGDLRIWCGKWGIFGF